MRPPQTLSLASCFALALATPIPSYAQIPAPAVNAAVEPWRQKLQEEEKALAAAMEKMPVSIRLLSRRGDARVFLGNFPAAVTDYEGMIALDPAQDAPHWRLGIAYYFDGQFAKAAAQFEKYHSFDNRDRENGVWKFFSQARAEGIEAARKGLLRYTQFDREPFPSVYRMLAGELSPAAVLAEVTQKGLDNDPRVLFFAKYYAGVMESLTGKKAEGLKLVQEAVALFNADAAGRDGPGYMWHSARLHADQLSREAAPRQQKEPLGEVPGVRSLEVCAEGGRLHMLLGELASPNAVPVLSYRSSADGGTTWSEPVQVNRDTPKPHGIHRGTDARLAVHGSRIVAAWTSAGTDAWGSGPLTVVASRDGGKTWAPCENPADDGRTDGHNFLALAADSKGVFHLAWLDSRDGDRGLRYAESKDGGLHWEKNHTAAPKTCECCWNSLAPLADGGIAILFRARAPRDMHVVTSSNAGLEWNKPVPVGGFQWDFSACPHVGGALITQQSSAGQQLHAAVWTGAPGASGMYHLRSDDAGRSWTAPHKMNVPLAWHPALAADSKNRLLAVWDTMTAASPETWGALSPDGGLTWNPPLLLSQPSAPAAHPRVVAVEGGFRVFWTEERPLQTAHWRSVLFPE
jgi:tetratricopeptide (TPR) repeat protein